jgi:CRISPR system Cascade subunit CasC
MRMDASLTPDEARAKAAAVFAALGIKLEGVKSKTAQKAEAAGDTREEYDTSQYLIFWSNRQLDRLARLALSSDKPTKKEAAEAADTGARD